MLGAAAWQIEKAISPVIGSDGKTRNIVGDPINAVFCSLFMRSLLLPFIFLPFLAAAEVIETDLLIVGGDESGCAAAAIQAARLGVKRIVLVNDIDWLGGQFCTQGIGPIDEWTIVNGKRAEYPASGAFARRSWSASISITARLRPRETRQRLVRQQHH